MYVNIFILIKRFFEQAVSGFVRLISKTRTNRRLKKKLSTCNCIYFGNQVSSANARYEWNFMISCQNFKKYYSLHLDVESQNCSFKIHHLSKSFQSFVIRLLKRENKTIRCNAKLVQLITITVGGDECAFVALWLASVT